VLGTSPAGVPSNGETAPSIKRQLSTGEMQSLGAKAKHAVNPEIPEMERRPQDIVNKKWKTPTPKTPAGEARGHQDQFKITHGHERTGTRVYGYRVENRRGCH